MSKQPKWATPERQAYLVKLWAEYGNKCLYGHTACFDPSHYVYTEAKGIKVAEPVKMPCCDRNGNPVKDRDGNQIYLTVYRTKTETFYELKVARLYELKAEQAIKAWIADDRERDEAERQAEQKAMHNLGERRYPLRGQFNAIGRDIFYGEQPLFYLEGIGISGLTFKPFAKVRLASSIVNLHIDISDSLKGMSKNAKRKALRHGKLTNTAWQGIDKAVRDYLNNY
jgi:hypothetical protein